MRDNKILSGVLVTLLTLTLLNNGLSAVHATKNNLLSIKPVIAPTADKAVFLLSKPTTDVVLRLLGLLPRQNLMVALLHSTVTLIREILHMEFFKLT